MRRLVLLASLALAIPTAGHTAVLATCSASTPRISPPPSVPVPPNNIPMWVPFSPQASCVKTFTQATTGTVNALVSPDSTFEGIVGLRVRGPNALYFQYEGVYVGGDLVSGQDADSLTLPAGNYTLEVYLGGALIPGGNGLRVGSFSVGTYSGSLSS